MRLKWDFNPVLCDADAVLYQLSSSLRSSFTSALKQHSNCKDLTNLMLKLQFNIYLPYMLCVHSYLQGIILNWHYNQFPVGLIAQVAEHCSGIAKVRIQIPQYWPEFFRCSLATSQEYFKLWGSDQPCNIVIVWQH